MEIDELQRYSIIENQHIKREIVLLKSFPCFWGRCSFCDYIHDNAEDVDMINTINFEVLKKIEGIYNVLEVINSGSCFELPRETLDRIKEIIGQKGIEKLFLESHWKYRNRLNEMRERFEIPIVFKTGIETFDSDFRNKVLNKGAYFRDHKEVRKYFESVCLLIGIKGQTRSMIQQDVEIALEHFPHATINIFVENSTPLKRDEKIIEWFRQEYGYLKDVSHIEVLYENTDFGVG